MLTRKMIVGIVVVVLALMSQQAWGTDYYVAKDGDDDANGMENFPWETIQKAADVMVGGDTVNIRAGEYNECVVIWKSGEPNSMITYQPHNDEDVEIVANDSGYGGRSCFEIVASNINISGLHINGGVGSPARGVRIPAYINNLILDNLLVDNCEYGIQFCDDGSQNCVVKNCTVKNVTSGGILVKCKHKGLLIENNHVFNVDCVDGVNGFGIEVNGRDDPCNNLVTDPDKPTGIIVRNNIVHDTAEYCIFAGNSKNCVIEDNICYNTGYTGIQIEGFGDGGLYRCKNFIVRNNTCYNCAQASTYEGGLWIHKTDYAIVEKNTIHSNVTGLFVSGSNNVISRYNCVYNNNHTISGQTNMATGIALFVSFSDPCNSEDNIFVHNTVFNNGQSNTFYPQVTINACWNLCYLAESNVLNTCFKNNIVAESQGAQADIFISGTTHILNHNNYYHSQREPNIWWDPDTKSVFYNPDKYSWYEYHVTEGQEPNSFISDPCFVDAAGGYFGLSEDSNAIDAGGFLTTTTSSGSSSMSVVVADARYFSDGFDVCDVDGDLIVVGSNDAVRVTDVNYDSNTLTVDTNISWNSGDGVSYPYSGSAPDIGCYESKIVRNLDKGTWYDTIQDAIDDSDGGDEIVVHPGTYYEAIDFDGNTVTLRGTDPTNMNAVAATVIDANGGARAVDVDSNSTIRGLTIRGGTYGVYCDSASPTISKCIIEDNSSAGVYCNGGSPEIENNKICDNSSYGIHSNGSSASIKNNWVYRNGDEGIHFAGTASPAPIVRNNTVAYNTNHGVLRETGNVTNPTISNCILWANNDDLDRCSATYSCIEDGDNGTGNIDSNPVFVDADSNDFHLEANSPCIEAGDSGGSYSGEVDIDFESRLFDADNDGNSIVDMGADETYWPLSWWKFDEGSGTTADDSSIGDNDGNLIGDPNWVSGQIGNFALDFNGVGDYVDVPSLTTLNYPFSVSVWAKMSDYSDGTYPTIVGKWIAGTDRQFVLSYHDACDVIYAHLYDDSDNSNQQVKSTYQPPLDVWFNAVLTYDGTNGKIYINGDLNVTREAEGDYLNDVDADVGIGARSDGSGAFFNGTIDDVRIYNRELSGTEILQLYQDGL